MLEEGLATNFSLMYAHLANSFYSTGSAKYDSANLCVKDLLAHHPDAIRHFREGGHQLSGFSTEELISHCIGLSESAAEVLAHPFQTWEE